MAKPRARRPRPRCSFVEDGRLCPRVGTGNPRLCDRHFRLVQERGAAPASDDGMAGVIGDILTGKKVSRERMGQAAVGIATGIFAVLGGAAAAASGKPMGSQRARPAPPRYDPAAARAASEAAELAAERLKARRVMNLPKEVTPELLKARYRELAKKHHPDRKGGSVSAMAAVNHANDVLSAEIG